MMFLTHYRRPGTLVSQIVLILLIISVTSACEQEEIFEKYQSFDGSWNQKEKPEFAVMISDTVNPVNFLVNIRHNNDYPYSNLILFINTFYPNGLQTRDTVEIMLARPGGEWLGSGFGDLKSSAVLLKRGVVFTMSGEYRFQFEQAMRTKSLEGMEDIGITIEKMQDN